MDAFEQRKKANLQKLKKALERKEVDPDIIPLLEIINQHPRLVTTSSCSGRILLLYRREKKIESEKYISWHSEITVKDLKEFLPENKYGLWLRFEPFIIHILAKDCETAFTVVQIFRNSGIKRVGVQKVRENYLIEAIGSEYISIPLFSCSCDEKIVEILNEHMRKNRERLKKVEITFSSYLKNHAKKRSK